MWNRDGGPRILQMFQIQQNSDLPPESCKNKSPVTHSDHRKREKWGLSVQPTCSLSHQHVRQSGKVCSALLALCFMFSACVCYMCKVHQCPHFQCVLYENLQHVCLCKTDGVFVFSCDVLQCVRTDPLKDHLSCVCLCVNVQNVCFLHFLLPSCLLFSVSSPTVSLPTRPVSLDLSHEEATFWLQWCVLKNPYLNSADPPAS